MTQLPIPYGPDEITPQWLTRALRSTGAISDCEVRDFNVEPGGEDRGITGNIARLTLRYNDGDYPGLRTLIAKFPSSDPDQRARGGRNGIYEREPKFYRELANDVNLRTPRVFYCDNSENNIDHVMLLEDLSYGRARSSIEGCSEREAGQAVKQLAEFHAQWWNSGQLDEYPWLPSMSGFPPVVRARYQAGYPPFLERFGSSIPSEVVKLITKLDRVLHASASRLSGPPVTLLHGDYALGNLIFDPPGDDQTIAVIDWQHVAIGVGVCDLGPFFHSYGDTDYRQEMERHFLSTYHSTLVAMGVTDYGLDQCLSDYLVATLWYLTRLIRTMSGLGDNANTPRFRLMLSRACTSLVEWNVLERLSIY